MGRKYLLPDNHTSRYKLPTFHTSNTSHEQVDDPKKALQHLSSGFISISTSFQPTNIIMSPHGNSNTSSSYARSRNDAKRSPRVSLDGLKRSASNLSFEVSKELEVETNAAALPPISEVEDARCECCGMIEECTLDYIDRIRNKFTGKWICGLCAEAVKEETDKNGGKMHEALSAHMTACVRFNKFSRAYPVLYQAEAMREILKKARSEERGVRAKSMNHRAGDKGSTLKKGGISRSTSCIPSITREMNLLKLPN